MGPVEGHLHPGGDEVVVVASVRDQDELRPVPSKHPGGQVDARVRLLSQGDGEEGVGVQEEEGEHERHHLKRTATTTSPPPHRVNGLEGSVVLAPLPPKTVAHSSPSVSEASVTGRRKRERESTSRSSSHSLE